MRLSVQEGRVLGCLVEKQLTTPQLYPLTENALIAACNQSTSREPVVAYDVATVRMAVRTLREKDLLRTVHRTGERSDKHQHLLEAQLALTPGQVALIAVLLLRGPQTVAELKLRTERMHPFGSLEQVEQELHALTGTEQPFVARLDRQPGRKEARYAQLLVEQDPGEPAPLPATAPEPPHAMEELFRNVEQLRGEVSDLREQVRHLQRDSGGTG